MRSDYDRAKLVKLQKVFAATSALLSANNCRQQEQKIAAPNKTVDPKPMNDANESVWLESVVQLKNGYESDAVARFTGRLLALAKSRMPERINQRVDPEDVVQSVFRTFFARNAAGQFVFQETPDVWRLLAAITYRKVQQTIRFHQRHQRDVQREESGMEHDERLPESEATASSLAIMVELVDRIIERIPEQHRDILKLRLENYSVDEIADRVEVSTRTVERALAIIRKTATSLLEE